MIDSYFANIEYDNMPHHPHVSSFPHHKHVKNKIIESQEPELILVIKEIKDIKL